MNHEPVAREAVRVHQYAIQKAQEKWVKLQCFVALPVGCLVMFCDSLRLLALVVW